MQRPRPLTKFSSDLTGIVVKVRRQTIAKKRTAGLNTPMFYLLYRIRLIWSKTLKNLSLYTLWLSGHDVFWPCHWSVWFSSEGEEGLRRLHFPSKGRFLNWGKALGNIN